MVAIVSGNLLVGPEHCRHDAYLDVAINFTNNCTLAPQQIKHFPKWLRSVFIPLGLAPVVTQSQAHRRRLKALLELMVTERRQLVEEGKPVPEDVLQWMVVGSPRGGIPLWPKLGLTLSTGEDDCPWDSQHRSLGVDAVAPYASIYPHHYLVRDWSVSQL